MRAPRDPAYLRWTFPTTPYHTALAQRKRKMRRQQQVALWTRVKRLRGGRSHMDSQTCFSKKPRCNSAMKIREKLLSSVSPAQKERKSQGQDLSVPAMVPPCRLRFKEVSRLHHRVPLAQQGPCHALSSSTKDLAEHLAARGISAVRKSQRVQALWSLQCPAVGSSSRQ